MILKKRLFLCLMFSFISMTTYADSITRYDGFTEIRRIEPYNSYHLGKVSFLLDHNDPNGVKKIELSSRVEPYPSDASQEGFPIFTTLQIVTTNGQTKKAFEKIKTEYQTFSYIHVDSLEGGSVQVELGFKHTVRDKALFLIQEALKDGRGGSLLFGQLAYRFNQYFEVRTEEELSREISLILANYKFENPQFYREMNDPRMKQNYPVDSLLLKLRPLFLNSPSHLNVIFKAAEILTSNCEPSDENYRDYMGYGEALYQSVLIHYSFNKKATKTAHAWLADWKLAQMFRLKKSSDTSAEAICPVNENGILDGDESLLKTEEEKKHKERLEYLREYFTHALSAQEFYDPHLLKMQAARIAYCLGDEIKVSSKELPFEVGYGDKTFSELYKWVVKKSEKKAALIEALGPESEGTSKVEIRKGVPYKTTFDGKGFVDLLEKVGELRIENKTLKSKHH